MMDANIRELVQQIHDAPPRIVLVTAGAGSEALAWLMAVPGASRTLIEGLVPYDSAAFNDFLGQEPAQYVSADVASARRSASSASISFRAPATSLVRASPRPRVNRVSASACG